MCSEVVSLTNSSVNHSAFRRFKLPEAPKCCRNHQNNMEYQIYFNNAKLFRSNWSLLAGAVLKCYVCYADCSKALKQLLLGRKCGERKWFQLSSTSFQCVLWICNSDIWNPEFNNIEPDMTWRRISDMTWCVFPERNVTNVWFFNQAYCCHTWSNQCSPNMLTDPLTLL